MPVDAIRLDMLQAKFRGELPRDHGSEREQRILADQLHDAATRQQGRRAARSKQR